MIKNVLVKNPDLIISYGLLKKLWVKNKGKGKI